VREYAALLDSRACLKTCEQYWLRQGVAVIAARAVLRDETFGAAWKAAATRMCRRNAALAFAQLDRTLHLVRLLENAGIPALALKGAALSLLLYDDPAFRGCGDIDLLVAPERLDEALALVREQGYTPAFPHHLDTEGRVCAEQFARRHDIVLLDPQGGSVELHWRLEPLGTLLPFSWAELDAAAMPVAPSCPELRTIGLPHLLAYLAVHAMNTRWPPMKWLYDLHAVVERFGDAALEPAYRIARSRDFEPLLDVALTLAGRLHGELSPTRCASARNRCAVNMAWRRLGDSRNAAENRRDPVMLALFRLSLLKHWRQRLRLVLSRWRRPGQ
jgi:hypothetical protein